MLQKSIDEIAEGIRKIIEIEPHLLFDPNFDGGGMYYFTQKYIGRCRNCGSEYGRDYIMHLSENSLSELKKHYENFLTQTGFKILDENTAELICSIFRPFIKFEYYRGCAQAKLFISFDNQLSRRISEKIRSVGMNIPRNEKGYFKRGNFKNYPPDESIFAVDDDIVFFNLLEGVAKSKSQEAFDLINFYCRDDEKDIAKYANELLNRYYAKQK